MIRNQEKTKHTLYFLVDYDNLDPAFMGRRLSLIIDNIVGLAFKFMHEEDVTICDHIVIRFYGGWYENEMLTRRAQSLIASMPWSPILYYFSKPPNRTDKHILRTRIELACGLISTPSVHLMATYRRREYLKGIQVIDPVKVGCDPNKCRILGIKDFIRNKRCPDCGTDANLILWRQEQKLVDVMLATDIFTLSITPDTIMCVVSSDEDFWPAIFNVSCTSKKRIYHMHAVPGRRLRMQYKKHANPTYVEIPL